MNRISVFAFAILLCSIVLALGPGVKVAIKQSTINNIKDQAIPIIMRQLKEITVPNINGNAGPIKYSISSIRARMESLAPSNVAIRLIPNSNRVGVSVSNLRGSGNFRVEFQFLFIKAGVDGSASINGVGVNVEMAFAYDGEGRPTANVAQFGINMGVNNVGISFSGSILAALVNVVVNLLKPIFVNIMRSILNNAVPGVMNNLINQLIRQLPMSVDISPALAIAFRLPKTPWVNSDYMCVAIAGYVYYKPSPHPPAYEPKACPDYEPASQKGIHFFLTDYVIRSALDATYSAGLMTIQVPVQADQYDIVMDCGATSAPVLQFSNSIVVDANAACKVTAKHKQTGQVMQFAMSAGANIKLTEKIKQQTLFFEIISLGVSNLKFDNPSKYDLKWFQDSINVVLQKAKETINALLGQRGIKLPNLPGIDYSDIEESAKNGYVEVLVTPVIHLQQSDLDLDRAIRELPGR